MKLKYTGDFNPEAELTVGKEYEVIATSRWFDSVRIRNDEGYEDWYHKANFENAKEATKNVRGQFVDVAG